METNRRIITFNRTHLRSTLSATRPTTSSRRNSPNPSATSSPAFRTWRRGTPDGFSPQMTRMNTNKKTPKTHSCLFVPFVANTVYPLQFPAIFIISLTTLKRFAKNFQVSKLSVNRTLKQRTTEKERKRNNSSALSCCKW